MKRIRLFFLINIAILVVLSMGLRIHSPNSLPESMQAFGISSGRAQGLKRLFMSHSPIEERVAALRDSARS